MRQLGNAVPVMLAQVVAASVREHLDLADVREAVAQRRAHHEPMLASVG
jgi:DNA (cytosine-5)-methyltransferase 1